MLRYIRISLVQFWSNIIFLHIDRNQSRLIMDNLSDTNQPEESLSHLDGDGKSYDRTIATSVIIYLFNIFD